MKNVRQYSPPEAEASSSRADHSAPQQTTTPGSEIMSGIRLSLAARLGMFPLGIAFGLLVAQSELPWWMAPALSIAGFAGSLELLLVDMMTAGVGLVAIAVTTLLVNFRHVFYAFSFPLDAVKNPAAKTYSVYALIDEAYAVTATQPKGWTAPRLLAMQVAFQSYWVGGGLAGVGLGALIGQPIEGLEFALCALFVTLALDAARTSAQIPSVVLAGAAFSVGYIFMPDQALVVGMLGFVALLAVRYVLRRTKGVPGV